MPPVDKFFSSYEHKISLIIKYLIRKNIIFFKFGTEVEIYAAKG
jgi:hypothetical protein